MTLLRKGQVEVHLPAKAKEVYDVTGAGDTVISALGYALALGKNLENSIKFANLAAGVVVGKLGSATTSLDEIEQYKNSLHIGDITTHIKSFYNIDKICQICRNKNQKIVFTNGCFDILHKGHASYLHTAKSYGDILIVGLNSDKSVKKLKGKNRPINTQDDRAYILASLQSVDYVVIFDEDTPYNLVKLIKPDVLVKGGDYKNKDVVGQDIAHTLKLVDFVDGKSTTKTIKSIQNV
jgi:D-beta-D-heptose 7-phosphate kinase/D-beta-D-heptose 1-phosphate adenosyltransferase